VSGDSRDPRSGGVGHEEQPSLDGRVGVRRRGQHSPRELWHRFQSLLSLLFIYRNHNGMDTSESNEDVTLANIFHCSEISLSTYVWYLKVVGTITWKKPASLLASGLDMNCSEMLK
jgi:hypothetical protein